MIFMFGVLGSVLFWISFIVMWFFAGCFTFRHFAPKTYALVTEKQTLISDDAVDGPFILICIFLFWPIIFAVIIINFLITAVFWTSICKLIKTTGSAMPDIKIKKKSDYEDI